MIEEVRRRPERAVGRQRLLGRDVEQRPADPAVAERAGRARPRRSGLHAPRSRAVAVGFIVSSSAAPITCRVLGSATRTSRRRRTSASSSGSSVAASRRSSGSADTNNGLRFVAHTSIPSARAAVASSRPTAPYPTMPSRLPRRTVPSKASAVEPSPFALTVEPGGQVPREHDHRRHRVLGHRGGVRARRVREQDRALGHPGEREVLDAGGDAVDPMDAREPEIARSSSDPSIPVTTISRSAGMALGEVGVVVGDEVGAVPSGRPRSPSDARREGSGATRSTGSGARSYGR